MSDRSTPSPDEETEVPISEYQKEQYLPGGVVSAAHRALLRAEFGRLRAFFKSRPGHHWKLQRKLDQARFGVTYDVYLTRVTTYAVVAWFVGALVGVAITVALTSLGVLEALSLPVDLPGNVASVVAANRTLFVGSTLILVGAFALAAVTWMSTYYYPAIVVDARRRSIDIMLPHAIVYMYALSFGGMDFGEVLRRMSEAEETYGEVANEFDTVVTDVEVFGSDLFTAMRNTRNLTPSGSLQQFIDDMLSVLDSGGNVTEFLEAESEKYMEQAADEQETFLESLATLSEVFIVAFVAAPLFLVVTLMMMSFLGASTVSTLYLLVYVLLPLGMACFLVIVVVLSAPYDPPGHQLDLEEQGGVLTDGVREHPLYDSFRRSRRRDRLRSFLRDPSILFKANPLLVLLVSVPAAVAVGWFLVASGPGELTVASLYDAPVSTAVAVFAAPFVVAATPVAGFFEFQRRRRRHVAKRFPDALNLLASANQMGVRLTEGFDLLARNYSGYFAAELRRVRNDIRWNHDIQRALLGLASRLGVPQLTRTCKIVAEGSRSTGDLHRVLGIAAEDTRHRYRLDRRRHREMSTYTAIVVMGFLVYLGVVVVIDRSFLGPMVAQTSGTTAVAGPISVSVDVATYHALFFHSALIQAVGTGLITGKLGDNELLSGLKYSIVLVLVAVGVFTFL